MKKIWEIVALVVAYYLLASYEASKSQTLDWTDIFGNMIVAYLLMAVLRGL